MKVYISGPITGKGDAAKETFAQAERELRDAGLEPVNPHAQDTVSNSEYESWSPEKREAFYHQALERDIRLLLDCDAVALLPGWRDSRGAFAEHHVACVTGKRISNVEEFVQEALDRQIEERAHDYSDQEPLGFTPGQRQEIRKKIAESFDVSEDVLGAPWEILIHGYGLQPPTYEGDVGYDLYVAHSKVIPAGAYVDLESKVRVALPEGTWGLVTGRSSTIRRKGLLVPNGVIDGGYRGPLPVGVLNVSWNPVRVEEGERLAQLIVMPAITPVLRTVASEAELPPSERGERAFGSTGR